MQKEMNLVLDDWMHFSNDYLETLEHVVVKQNLLSQQIRTNGDKLIHRKREEKMSSKELKKLAKMHEIEIKNLKGNQQGFPNSVSNLTLI